MLKCFLIQAIVCCACFHIIITYSVKKAPMSWFYDYPKAVQERVRSLPEYTGKIPSSNYNLKKKIISAAFCVAFLICMAWIAGTRSFGGTMAYSFSLWTVINFYDALVLDTIWFCHNKKIRFHGTEDLAPVYENPKKHWVDFLIGTIIGLIVSILAGGGMALLRIVIG